MYFVVVGRPNGTYFALTGCCLPQCRSGFKFFNIFCSCFQSSRSNPGLGLTQAVKCRVGKQIFDSELLFIETIYLFLSVICIMHHYNFRCVPNAKYIF